MTTSSQEKNRSLLDLTYLFLGWSYQKPVSFSKGSRAVVEVGRTVVGNIRDVGEGNRSRGERWSDRGKIRKAGTEKEAAEAGQDNQSGSDTAPEEEFTTFAHGLSRVLYNIFYREMVRSVKLKGTK
jgi:hypothetical protein